MMKRTWYALVLALAVFSAFDGAAAKKRTRKPPQETRVTKATGTAVPAVSLERGRKQGGAASEENASNGKKPVRIGPPVERHLTRAKGKVFDLRTLPSTRPRQRERPERHGPEPDPVMVEVPEGLHTPGTEAFPLPVIEAAAPAPIITFEGLDRENWGAGSPPDTTGDVGPTYYIQGVNTSIGVYRKSDGFREAAFTFDTLMSQGNFGNMCDDSNFGDPVVLYDTFEDRWILTDFAFQLDGNGNVFPEVAFQCFAVSMNGNPISGGWNFYSIQVDDGLHDYEKLGVWTDGIYMSANMFGFPASGSFEGARAWAINKAQMYAGSPTVQVVSFDIGGGDFTVIPSNARLQTGTPPAGRPNYFMSTGNFLNAVSVYKFHVDWTSISLSTLTGPELSTSATSWPDANVDNVPQSGTAQLLDTLQLRTMVQNQYSNIGGAESLWVPHTVRRQTTTELTGFAAPRWYQVNVTGGTVAASLPQAKTWDPDGSNVMHRFMPSLAVDRLGNLAMAYSTSSSSTFPSIKYAGRLATDPVNTFSQTEQILFTGTASQTTIDRWGDYSSVMLDPDGCTFWITNEYANPVSQAFDKRWKTRIGSFKYPSCTPVGAGGTLSGTVTAAVGGAPISGAAIAFGARSTTTNGSGVYSFTGVPAGTYPLVTASFPGYVTGSSTTIAITDGGTTTRNFSLATAPASACLTDTTQADFQAGVPSNVSLTGSPGNVTLASPDSIDKQTTNYTTNGVGFSGTSYSGQTFTPAVTGTLKRIDVEIFCASCSGANPNLTVEARTTSSGNIVMTAGGLLASSTIAGTSSGSGGFMTFTFSSPPTLTGGTQYGFVVRSATTRTTGTQAVLVSDGDGLAGGRRQTCSSASCSNSSGQSNDVVFISYMNFGFAASGNLISSAKDSNPGAGLTPTWSTLSWNATVPANTTLRFQAAGSNSVSGPFTFVGPDGTAATFFTTTGASLSQFYNKRFLQYKAYLATTNTAVSPTLNDVTVCYSDVDCSSTTATITPAPAQVCANSAGNTASGPAGAASYAWSITNGTIQGSTTSQSVSYTAGASGTVGLTLFIIAANNCQATSSTNVTINPVPPTPTVTPGGPTTFCTGGSVTLTSSSASGNQWYDGLTLLVGQTNQTYVATTTGSYNVKVTASGCTSAPSTSTVVTVNPIPATPTVTPSGPTTFCAGGSVTLTSSSASGNQWYDGVTLLVGQTNQTYVATTTGSYNVKVTASGCTSAASASTAVTVNPTPATPTVTPGGPTTFCTGGSVTLTSSSASGNQWYDGVTLLVGHTNQTYVATTTGSYNVKVTASGCTSAPSTSTVVTVNPIPATPTITPGGPTTFCTGGSVTLTSSSATGNQWYDGVTLLVGQTNQTYVATTSGNYNVIVTTAGCSSAPSSSTAVTVNPTPATPTVTPGGPTTFCTGGSVTLTSSSASGNQWYDGLTLLGGQTNQTYVATTSGSYNVKVTTNGCTSAASSSTSVTVNPTPATPTITPGGPTTFCTGGSVTLTSSSASGNQWYDGLTLLGGQTNQTYVATTSGNYNVVVTTNGCPSAPSAPTAVTVNPIPATPTVTPSGPTTFCTGGSVTLTSSSATGNQWYDGLTLLVGQTNQTYVATTSGNYNVKVTTNGCSSAASSSTAVTVNPTPATPTITPSGPTTFCTGGSVTLTSSSASGNQWYDGATLLVGQTNQTYVATTSGSYNVVVTTNGCPSAPSASTAVTVNPIPATPTVTPSGPTTFCSGGSVTLTSSSASGNQWYDGVTLLSGETNQTYVATTTGNYNVVVTTNGCSSAPSSSTVVTVNPTPATPTITPSGPTTFCAGGSVTLTSSSATGNQWYDGVTLLVGQTNQTYVATTSGNYNVVVTTNGCPSAPSASTAVTVNPIPATPTVTPSGPTTFCAGGSVTLTSSSASGNQWYDGVTPLAGETNQTYVATTSGNFNVVVTASGCSSPPSSSTAVTVNPTPATPTITPSGPTTFCMGGSVTLTSSSATGNQWFNGLTPLVGETNQTYVATTSGNYNVVVTTNGCPSAPSASTPVTVNPVPATPTVTPSGPTTFCSGGSVTLTSSNSSGNQWYDGVTLLVGQTNQTYVATTSGNYNVVVTTSGCSSAPSSSTTVTVNPTPATPTITPGGPTTFCAGGSVTLTSSSASGNQWFNGLTLLAGETNQTYVATTSGNYNVVVTAGGCSSAPSTSTAVTVNPTPATPTITPGGPTTFCTGGNVTLTSSSATGNQWFNGVTPLAGETNQTYVATTSGNYNVVVTTSGCSSAPSSSTAVTVNPTPATPTVTPGGPTTFCTGGSVTLTSSSATGNQWYDGLTPLGGETNQTYVATTSGTYNVVVTAGGCSSAPSASTAVTVNPTPATPTITPGGPTTFCTGGSVTLTSSSATGNQWFNGVTQLAGETNQTYVATTSGNYNVVVTTSGCSSAPSSSTVVTVNPTPATPTVTPGGPTTFCAGGSVTLTSSSATGNQWFNGVTLLPGQTNQTYVATASGNYNVVVTVSGCSSAPSASTTVTVNPIPPTPTITPGGPTTFCAGGSVTLTSSSATGNQWFLGGNPIGGATSQLFNATASGNYTVVVTANGCSSAPSASTTVAVNPIPSAPTVTPGGPTTFCEGGSVTLTSSSGSGNQWYRDGAPLGGETAQTYVATLAGLYTVTVTTNGCPSPASAQTLVTVNPKPDATITVVSPMFSGASANASVAVSCAGASFAWTITGGTITAGAGTPVITFTAGAAGTLTLSVTVTTAAGCTDTKTVNVTVQTAAFGPPPFFRATASGTTSANLNWASVQSAAHYEIHRSTDNVNWTLRGTSAGTTFSEGGLTPSTTYFYKVRTVKADTTLSAFSAIDAATTIVLTDDPITMCGTLIKAVHITQLRTAVNIARASVGLSAFTFTDPSLAAGSLIKMVHVAELRTALAPLLTAIGNTPSYTDPTLTAGVTKVKSAHVQELRDLIR